MNKKALWAGGVLSALVAGSALAANLPNAIQGLVHLQGIGDAPLAEGQWAGTRGESRRLEGFQLSLHPALMNGVEYMCHLQDYGDTPWMRGGNFCGTRGESRRLEGFSIRLTGVMARYFNVRYQCHLQDIGDTAIYANGAFCGTRGQSRRLEAMRVWLEPR